MKRKSNFIKNGSLRTKYAHTGNTKYAHTGNTKYAHTGNTKYAHTGNTKHAHTGNTKHAHTGNTKYAHTGNTKHAHTGNTKHGSCKGHCVSLGTFSMWYVFKRSKVKVKLSRHTPWRQMGGQEV
jgi:hypothetical protein